MPIISEQDSDASTPVIPQTTVPTPAATGGGGPGALDVASAALRQSNIVSSVFDRLENGGNRGYASVPNYDPYANDGAEIRGYETYATRFSSSQSPAETQSIKNQISNELADKATLSRAGIPGFAASIAAGAVDPISLTAMLIPGLGEVGVGSRLARIAGLVASNVAAGEAQAGALAANSQTTNYADNIVPRIGANALLSGILGHIATRVPRPELDQLAARTSQNLEAPVSSTAGAAAVPTTTLEQESIARGGQMIAKTVGQVSPVTRIFTNSAVPETRQLAQQLVDPGFMLEKNLQGVATPTSVEMRVNQIENVRNAQLFQKFDAEFADYKQEGGELTKPEFSEAVSDAMRNSDSHDIKQVKNVAQFTRPMFDGDREILTKLGAIPDAKGTVGAPSYFPRAYDVPMILKNQTDLEQRLTDWFTQNPKLDKDGIAMQREPAEVSDAVRDTMNNIMGIPRGTADLGQVKNPSVLKGRTLDVPDSILRPYLSSDFEHVIGSYNRTVLPQVEMRRTFGSTTLKDEFAAIRDAYAIKLNYAASDAEKAKLSEQHKADIADLTLLRDRVLNQTGPRGNESLNMVRAAQLVRSFNYLRMLGGQTLSAIPDVGRLVTRYGLFNTGRRLAAFLGSSEARAMTKADAQRMGTALDTVLHTRMHSLEGIGDDMAGSQLSQRMHNATAQFTKLTGIAAWDSMMRTLSSQLEQDALHRLINKGNVSTLERGKLAAHGIGDAELPAIKAQWDKFGSNENGLNRARTELWKDQDAAARVEQAVQRAGSSNAFFVGKGDLPGFANSQLGKLVLQFKSFAISSVNRLAIPLGQGLAHRDVMAANGLASMLALGALTYHVRELASGREPDLSPHNLIPEAVQRSGVLTYIPDLYDPVAGSLHLPRFSKFQDLNPLETAAGPTFGTGAALLDVVRRLTKGNVSAADMHKLRQLMPYQNLFYFTRLVNLIEGKAADVIGAKGATGKDAADYFNPAQDTAPIAKTDKDHFLGLQQVPNAF